VAVTQAQVEAMEEATQAWAEANLEAMEETPARAEANLADMEEETPA